MSATLHVTCPVCSQRIDTVVPVETWGMVQPDDYGCVTVTVMDSAVSEHMETHSMLERLTSQRAYYAARGANDEILARYDDYLAAVRAIATDGAALA